MKIIPAIDLKDGLAVRLSKGLMQSAKIYSSAPWELAAEFENAGAQWLHLVDLNGAFAGEPKNLETIKKIRNKTDLKVELGGGIRDEETIKKYIDMGINRVILGSIALKNPKFVENMSKKYPIVVGIDAINGFVAVEGWAQTSNIKASVLAQKFANAGVSAIICTDVSKDGMLCGVNVEFTLEIATASNLPVIASGGVKDMNDIDALLKTKKIDGVIIGKAYYEGTINLKEAYSRIL
ncbi:MAG: 1-(5-phosphoribosyl)-5-[(5-phosphoribosylamino)methylideneamino]imidazole-4-carboxamide isomerase [Campylobacteraceae bacterium]|jgi:phosphoribosylformimino-5-aminoimidazole carboxamide ribotide isomerase|nr:1-(5-phosphoribosyl)-5-[(5-phosphoribosylamino)methylideneamino]imidazole-4-carboxamide isomerase [Campylobacteraceae bacterium]